MVTEPLWSAHSRFAQSQHLHRGTGNLWQVDRRRGLLSVCALTAVAVVQVQDRFRNAYQEVKTTMAQLYSFFQTDSEEVQREWLKFTQKVDPCSAAIHTTSVCIACISPVLPAFLHALILSMAC